MTPGTPDIPGDITTLAGGQSPQPVWSTVSEPVSFEGCQELARAVKYCSKSLIEGAWTEDSTVRGRRPLFRPADFESAKAFLRASVEVIHDKRSSRSVSDTPLSSRLGTAEEMVTCHGCHGRMGQGQHQGSAPGKIPCTLPHSFYCRGGVIEDVSWRACPTGYVFDPNVDLAAGPGFESTLGSMNFQPPSQNQNGPGFSTPIVQSDGHLYQGPPQHDPLVPPGQAVHFPQAPQHQDVSLGAISRLVVGDRYPGMVQIDRRILSQEFPPSTVPQVPEIFQDRINDLRSRNQAAASSGEMPGAGIDITYLRRNPDLQVGVENVIEGLIRTRIPSLSAADSALTPSGTTPTAGAIINTAAQENQVNDGGSNVNVGALPVISQDQLPGNVHHVPVVAAPQQQPVHPLQQPAQQAVPPVAVFHPQGNQQPSPYGSAQQQQSVQQQVVTPPVTVHFGSASHYQGIQQPSPHGAAQQQQLVQPPGVAPLQILVSNPSHQAPQHNGFQPVQQSSLHQAVPLNLVPLQQPAQHSVSATVVHPQSVQQPQHQQVHGGHGQTGHFLGSAAGGTSQHYSQQILGNNLNNQQFYSPLLTTTPAAQPMANQAYQAMFQQPTVTPLPAHTHGQQQPSYSTPGQPSLSQQSGANPVTYCYEWLTDGTGQRILVRTPVPQHGSQAPQQQVQTPVPVPQHQPHQFGQPGIMPTPPAPMPTPQVAYRVEYRCSPTTGRQWKVQIPVASSTTAAAPQFRHEWRIHPHTGVPYQVQVSVQGAVPMSNSSHQPMPNLVQQPMSNLAHQSATPQPSAPAPSLAPGTSQQIVQQPLNRPSLDVSMQQAQQSFLQHSDLQQNNSTLSRQDRVAGIVSLLEGGTTKKQPKVLEFARTCSTKWSKQATLTNINLPLYAWGAVTEIEASLSGRSESMSDSMMLGKLRHLKNTLEVCCLNSNSTDFSGYGWTLAKDYATKVDNEVEQRLATWQDMPAGVRTATLVSAQMENPRPPPRSDPPKRLLNVVEKKDLCTSYNTCTTEGKCDYEVANPDKKCIKKHECSYCMKQKKQSWRHQAARCRAKAEAGGH